jgi:hypothetical protein
MSGAQAGSTNRGNQADYMLGTAEGWTAFSVVRWHGVEELSRPFLYDITLTRDASSGPVDLDTLLDTGATFAIHGQSGWRMVHGILAETAEIDQTSQTILYRVPNPTVRCGALRGGRRRDRAQAASPLPWRPGQRCAKRFSQVKTMRHVQDPTPRRLDSLAPLIVARRCCSRVHARGARRYHLRASFLGRRAQGAAVTPLDRPD